MKKILKSKLGENKIKSDAAKSDVANCILAVDIGGTSTKIIVVKQNKLNELDIIFKLKVETKKFSIDFLKKTLEKYKTTHHINITRSVFACAGKVNELTAKKVIIKANYNQIMQVKYRTCTLSHVNLTMDSRFLEKELDCPVSIINDVEAVAHFAKKQNPNSMIVSIGTGLGVSFVDSRSKVISSEDGHMKIDSILASMLRVEEDKQTDRDKIASMKNKKAVKSAKTKILKSELTDAKIIEYEDLLAGGNNYMLAKIQESKSKFSNSESKNDSKNTNFIVLKKDNFSKIYLFILDSFMLKVFAKHDELEIKSLILAGGVVRGNKKFFSEWTESMKKNWAIKIVVIDDEFAGASGAAIYSSL